MHSCISMVIVTSHIFEMQKHNRDVALHILSTDKGSPPKESDTVVELVNGHSCVMH